MEHTKRRRIRPIMAICNQGNIDFLHMRITPCYWFSSPTALLGQYTIVRDYVRQRRRRVAAADVRAPVPSAGPWVPRRQRDAVNLPRAVPASPPGCRGRVQESGRRTALARIAGVHTWSCWPTFPMSGPMPPSKRDATSCCWRRGCPPPAGPSPRWRPRGGRLARSTRTSGLRGSRPSPRFPGRLDTV